MIECVYIVCLLISMYWFSTSADRDSRSSLCAYCCLSSTISPFLRLYILSIAIDFRSQHDHQQPTNETSQLLLHPHLSSSARVHLVDSHPSTSALSSIDITRMRQPSGRSHSFKHRSPGRPIIIDHHRFAVDDNVGDNNIVDPHSQQQYNNNQQQQQQTRRRSTPNVTRRSSFNQR